MIGNDEIYYLALEVGSSSFFLISSLSRVDLSILYTYGDQAK